MFSKYEKLIMNMNVHILKKIESITLAILKKEGVALHLKASLIWSAKDKQELEQLINDCWTNPIRINEQMITFFYNMRKWRLNQMKLI